VTHSRIPAEWALFDVHVYIAGVNGIGIPDLGLLLCPGKGLPGGFFLNAQVDGFPDQMPAAGYASHIGVMPALPESAGNKTHTFQFCSGSVG